MQLRGARVVVTNWRDPDHSLAGGAERYAWELCRGLRDAGAEVSFLTARERGQTSSSVREGIRIVRRGGRLSYYLLGALWLLLRRRSVDAVVDLESGIPMFSPVLVSRRRTGVMLVLHHVHQDQFGVYFPGPVAWFGRFLEGTVMPRVYRGLTTVAVSASTRQDMVRRLGWTGPIELLHNGSLAPQANATVPEDTVDRMIVLGRLSSHKRVDLVVRAVGVLQARRPGLHLDVVGSGPEREGLEALVRDLDIEKHVTFHGFVSEDEKARLLSRSRLHVCASDVEGWGQVVMEAAAFGVPTIARDVPGLRDSVRHERTGWLLPEPVTDLAVVQARFVVGIETALDELEDPERMNEISAGCRSWAAQFDWETMRAGAVALVAHTMKGAS